MNIEIGDRVFVDDSSSDLHIFDGEVLELQGNKALVLIETCFGYIADKFKLNNLCILRKGQI